MTCPTCNGCRETVVVRVTIDPVSGRELYEHHAETCSTCNGRGEVE